MLLYSMLFGHLLLQTLKKLEMLGGFGLCLQCEQVAGHMSLYVTAALARLLHETK